MPQVWDETEESVMSLFYRVREGNIQALHGKYDSSGLLRMEDGSFVGKKTLERDYHVDLEKAKDVAIAYLRKREDRLVDEMSKVHAQLDWTNSLRPGDLDPSA